MDIINFVKEAHGDQKYTSGVPYWLHVVRVGNLLRNLLENFGEANEKEIEIIYKSALLHDVIEDTNVSLDDLESKFGADIKNLVEELTDYNHDKSGSPEYIEKMARASEEAKLIKLADLFDNIHSAIRYLFNNGIKWTKDYFLKRVEPMCSIMLDAVFVKYQKISGILKKEVKLALDLLKTEIELYEKFKINNR